MKTTLLAAFLLLLASCGSTKQWETNRAALDFAVQEVETGNLQTVTARMQAVLSETSSKPADFAMQRFFSAFMLAQAHLAASLDRPFLEEATSAGSRIGGIGQRASSTGQRLRPSMTGHLTAAIYHASVARGMVGSAASSGNDRDGVALVPDRLASLGPMDADANLQVLMGSAYARLGFQAEVRNFLDGSPQLLVVESCGTTLDRLQVQPKLRPWIHAMIWEHLSGNDPRDAFPFGVLALEGGARHGLALPRQVADRIDDWIRTGSTIQFVCRKDGTPFVTGLQSCPNCSSPHLEYVAKERSATP